MLHIHSFLYVLYGSLYRFMFLFIILFNVYVKFFFYVLYFLSFLCGSDRSVV